jgi:hypothetical protein
MRFQLLAMILLLLLYLSRSTLRRRSKATVVCSTAGDRNVKIIQRHVLEGSAAVSRRVATRPHGKQGGFSSIESCRQINCVNGQRLGADWALMTSEETLRWTKAIHLSPP